MGFYRRPKHRSRTPEAPVERVRLPRENEREQLGIVIALVGGSRMQVECKDGKIRLCRIPGRLKNAVWVKDGDVVILKPWEIEGDKRGDIVWRYRPLQVDWLRRKGFL